MRRYVWEQTGLLRADLRVVEMTSRSRHFQKRNRCGEGLYLKTMAQQVWEIEMCDRE